MALLLTHLLAHTAQAENWPHWRGPRLDGTSTETGLPTTWSAEGSERTNVRWRLDLPGQAASSPIVWDDAIFLTSTAPPDETAGKGAPDGLLVLAVGKDGAVRWRTDVDPGSVKVFEQFAHETSAASPSPVTDGERIYALFGNARLYALGMDGKVAWSADLAERHGAPSLYFGLATTPLLHGDLVVVPWLHANGQKILALDRATGEDVWVHERPTDATNECLHAYSSVMPYAAGKEADTEGLLLVHGGDYLTAHRAADGAERWRFGTVNPKEGYNPMFRLVATPAVAADGLIVVPTAKRGPVFGLVPGQPGADAKDPVRITADDTRLRWTLDRGTPDVPSPIVHDDLVYLADENGRLTVLDAKDAATVYAERVHQSTHRASPILADGHLYLTATDGTVSVVRAGRDYELVAKNQVDGGRLSATPAVSGGTIYLRTYEALFAIGGDPVETAEPESATR